MRRRRKLPPWSRHHEDWCAIFLGKPYGVVSVGGQSWLGRARFRSSSAQAAVRSTKWSKPKRDRGLSIII